MRMAMAMTALLAGVSAHGAPVDLTLHLKGSSPETRINARYRCDAMGAKLGLPAGVFRVRFVRAGETSLAILPVKGEDLVFAQVLSADGGRYTAGRYEFWTARETTFSTGEGPEAERSVCRSIE